MDHIDIVHYCADGIEGRQRLLHFSRYWNTRRLCLNSRELLTLEGFQFEVIFMNRHRIHQVRVGRVADFPLL